MNTAGPRSVAWRGGLISAFLVIASLTPASAQTSQPAEAVQSGGTLTVAIEDDLRDFDALQARVSVDKMVMGSTVYDSLFQTDENANSLPALATSATASDDAKVWTFEIRQGVLFQNGKPFTAEDVKKNIEAYLDPKMASNMAGDLANIDKVEVPNDHEVKITLKRPDGRLPSVFTDNIFITDMDHYQKDHPIGTGPYIWDERVIGDHITFKRFDQHWRGRPPLDKVVFRVIPDAQVAALELQSGSVDVVPNYISVDALPSLRADPNLQIIETNGTTVYQAFLNFEKARRGGYKDFDAFRQGMADLWNSEKLVPPIIGEFGQLATQIIPPAQAGSDPTIKPWPYKPDEGKALLAKAGFGPGSDIYLLVSARPFNCDQATALASELTELGYKPRVVCIPADTVPPTEVKYDWDLLFARTSGRPTAYQMYNDRWRMSLADPPNDIYTMRDPNLEATINAMGAATDPEKYAELGRQAAQTIIKKDIAVLPGYWDEVRFAASKRVHGIKISPTAWFGFLMNQMTTVWVDQK